MPDNYRESLKPASTTVIFESFRVNCFSLASFSKFKYFMQSESNLDVSTDDEISLLDLLLVVVQNLRLLLITPLVVGLVALGVISMLPRTYESTAVQMGDTQLVSMYNSAQVRDAVVAELKYARPDEDLDSARERLSNDLKATFNNKDKTVGITARAPKPEAAQRMANVAVAQANMLNQSRADDVARLRAQFDLATKREFDHSSAVDRIAQQDKTLSRASSNLSSTQVQLVDASRDAQISLSSLVDALAKVQRFDILQQPTLPTKPVPKKRAMLGAIAALATGFLLLIFVFTRQALRNAETNPESAQKLAQLRTAWRRAVGQKEG